MHERGVRGVRFNMVSGNGTPEDQLDALARRLAPLGWHIQIYAEGDKLADVAPRLASLPVDVVIDHSGGVRAALGTAHPQFQALLRLLDSGRAWIKVCSYRASSAGQPWSDVAPNVKALVAAAPERCVWGTDWPHPQMDPSPEAGLLFDQFVEWVPDAALRQRVLVDNAAQVVRLLMARACLSSNCRCSAMRRFMIGRVSAPPDQPVKPVSATAFPIAAGSGAIARPRPRRLRGLAAYALLLPSGVFLLAFTYWPVLQVAIGSLSVQAFGGAAHWGFGNYARLFADPHFASAVRNNLVYAAGTIIPSLTLALLFALGLRESTRLTALLRTLFVLPLLIPLVAAASLFIFIFLPGAGLLDYYLARLGAAETNWLGDPSLALGSIIAITVWKNTGYYMLFFLAGLAGIPQELLDAAKIDGANAVQRFLRITLPLLGPTLAFVLVIAVLNVLTQVDHVIVMTQGGPSDATSLLLYYIYQQAHQNYDIGLASAATVVSVAFLFTLSVVSLRTLERGIHYET